MGGHTWSVSVFSMSSHDFPLRADSIFNINWSFSSCNILLLAELSRLLSLDSLHVSLLATFCSRDVTDNFHVFHTNCNSYQRNILHDLEYTYIQHHLAM